MLVTLDNPDNLRDTYRPRDIAYIDYVAHIKRTPLLEDQPIARSKGCDPLLLY